MAEFNKDELLKKLGNDIPNDLRTKIVEAINEYEPPIVSDKKIDAIIDYFGALFANHAYSREERYKPVSDYLEIPKLCCALNLTLLNSSEVKRASLGTNMESFFNNDFGARFNYFMNFIDGRLEFEYVYADDGHPAPKEQSKYSKEILEAFKNDDYFSKLKFVKLLSEEFKDFLYEAYNYCDSILRKNNLTYESAIDFAITRRPDFINALTKEKLFYQEAEKYIDELYSSGELEKQRRRCLMGFNTIEEFIEHRKTLKKQLEETRQLYEELGTLSEQYKQKLRKKINKEIPSKKGYVSTELQRQRSNKFWEAQDKVLNKVKALGNKSVENIQKANQIYRDAINELDM